MNKRNPFRSFNYERPWIPYAYLAPHALFFLAFILYPVAYGLWISVISWDPLSDYQPFVGADHYGNLFVEDSPQSEFFWKTLGNTLFFVGVSVPLQVMTALGLALLVFKPITGRGFFRTAFFFPTIISVAVMGLLWRWLFDNQAGLVNIVGHEWFHTNMVPYLTTEGLAWLPIILGTVWWTVGFNMTVFIAAMGGISASLYEAATIDGASKARQFFRITLPLLSETMLFVTVTTALGAFQLFGQPLIITNGGPLRSTQSSIMYITEEAFSNNQFSSAAAMAFVFGLVMMVFTVLQFWITNRNSGDTQ